MTCPKSDAFVHAFVDGELAGLDRDEFERHLRDCAECARTARLLARFKAAVRVSLPRPAVPQSLRRRLDVALGAAPAPAGGWLRLSYPRLVPAAAAAVLLVVITVTVRGRSWVMGFAEDSFHRPVPMDVLGPDCANVASWFQGKLDFPMKTPPFGCGVKCKGGRLMNVRDRPAAYLVMQSPDGSLMKVLVFDARHEPIETPRRVRVNDREIYYDEAPGVVSAAFRDSGGLGYVVTSDMKQKDFVEVVSAAVRQ